jgi:hypothetical protein
MMQPRNWKTGRFEKWEGTSWERYKKKKITLNDVSKAFIAGMNSQGGIQLPSKKLSIYMKENGYQ